MVNQNSGIGIIIINYNNWLDSLELLKSLNKQLTNLNFEVVFIDNNSLNQKIITREIQKLKLDYQLKLLKNKKNLGFAAAVNQGLIFLKPRVDYFLLLNNDSLLPPNFLDCLFREYQKLPKGSILGPLIKHQVNNQTLYGGDGYIIKPLALAKHHNYNYIPENKEIKKVDFISGCSMFFDKKIITKGLSFDDHYFLYLEDVDFCLQAKKFGFNSYLTFNCFLYHKQSRSFKKPTDKLKFSFVSNLKFAWKNFKIYLPIWFFFLPLFYLYLYFLWSGSGLRKRLKKIIGREV